MGEEDYPEEYPMREIQENFYEAAYGTPYVGSRDQAVALLEERIAQIMRGESRRMQVRVGGVVRTETLAERLRRERDELATTIAHLTSKLVERETQLGELDRYPAEDPYADTPDDAVVSLRFTKIWPGSEQPYTYVASRIDGKWYVSGDRAPKAVDWAGFVAWLGLGVGEITKIAPGRAAKVAW